MVETAGERLRKARQDSGYENAREAADALGVNYTTYGQHENGTRNIPAKAAEKYSRKFKVSLDWLLTGRPSKTELTTPANKPAKINSVPVIGSVKAGAWQDIEGWGEPSMAEFVPSLGEYPLDWQFALTVDGSSLNRVARHGDKLVCVDLIKSGIPIKEDDLVIVERTRFGGQMIERTAKRVRRTIGGFELWPESTDPEFQAPIPYRPEDGAGEVAITAKVIWILRQP